MDMDGEERAIMKDRLFVIRIIESLRSDAMAWKFDAHYARCGQIEIWTGNRPYADCTIYGMRIGNWWTRRLLRKALDDARRSALSVCLATPSAP